MQELLEKESKCLQLEETHDEEIEHMKGKLKKLQRELEETTQLQVEKMTLEIKLQEMEEKMRSGGMEIATPKTDRKLNKVYGIFGKFYGKQKEENDGESKSRCVISPVEYLRVTMVNYHLGVSQREDHLYFIDFDL